MGYNNYLGFRDLIVYQKSYKLAIDIFHLSKTLPADEKFVLTDQMRRSSRSIPSNIAEAWSRRRYPKSFVNKLIDSHGEEMEMEVWIDMAFDFKYIRKTVHDEILIRLTEISKMLTSMENNPEKFCHLPK